VKVRDARVFEILDSISILLKSRMSEQSRLIRAI
jgi:hypothetical protein